jgi:hypothetical protein
MGNDDAVYLAKLAEQAERYEGMFDMGSPASSWLVLTSVPLQQKWSRT